MDEISTLGARLRQLRRERGLTQEQLAEKAGLSKDVISKLEQGQRASAKIDTVVQLASGLGIELQKLLDGADSQSLVIPGKTQDNAASRAIADDEIAALELTRLASASDLGPRALEQLELMVDDLAAAYTMTAPGALLDEVRINLDYARHLFDLRATLAERRRLLVAGGWLSLLAATCAIDLHYDRTTAAYLRTAAQLADEAEHAEIAAWCLETRAWQQLTRKEYRRAAELAQGAQRIAPQTSSAYIQATAQEGRAWARLEAVPEAYGALARVEALASSMPNPERPEHHYRYDPAKSETYIATTLAWLGDPAAEDYARSVLARLESGKNGIRPRRAALARLDLSLALVGAQQHDEAAGFTLEAITSGRLVPSSYWRAREIIDAVAARGVPGACELDEAYQDCCTLVS